MPIDLKGTMYRLTYLDTNVVSDVSKREEPERSALFEFFISKRIAPCYSVLSIIEIMEKPDIFKSYIECFGILPSVIVKGHDQLVEEEMKAYPDPSKIDPVIVSPWGLRDSYLSDPRDKLKKLIDLSGADKRRSTWKRDKPIILNGMLSLVKNYPPSGDKYTKQEARDFVRKVNYQHLGFQFPSFIQKLESSGQDFDIDAFPSLKMMAFSVFHKFYADRKRKPLESDVFDILMSTILPYVDIAYLERGQAEILHKTKRIDPFISRLEVGTLTDLRAKIT